MTAQTMDALQAREAKFEDVRRRLEGQPPYDKPQSLREIAAAYGVKHQAVDKWIKKRGLEARPSGYQPRDPEGKRQLARERLTQLYRRQAEVAAEGHTSPTIDKRIGQLEAQLREQWPKEANREIAAARKAAKKAGIS